MEPVASKSESGRLKKRPIRDVLPGQGRKRPGKGTHESRRDVDLERRPMGQYQLHPEGDHQWQRLLPNYPHLAVHMPNVWVDYRNASSSVDTFDVRATGEVNVTGQGWD